MAGPAAVAGIASGAGSVLSGIMAYQGKKQDYVNQVAYKKASDEFARWSARQQASQADINNQYKFWQERINYGQELAYTNELRNYELSTAIANAEEVARARASAGADYMQESAAYAEAFRQEAMADAVALMQYKVQALKARSSVAAGATGGKSIDRLINDYSRQVGDYETLQNINQGFKERQFTNKQAGAISKYLNQYNSQQFYQQREYQDPMPPFSPLPTLVSAPGPSMVGGAPSLGAAIVGSIAGGVSAGAGTYAALK
tara:strand:+ start:49 stop:828 length:780 start_codon:yes stop_codon:yes gene_type:complete